MENICPICSDNVNYLRNGCELSCGHYFHRHCIDQWWEKIDDPSCPYCKASDNRLMTEMKLRLDDFILKRITTNYIIRDKFENIISCYQHCNSGNTSIIRINEWIADGHLEILKYVFSKRLDVNFKRGFISKSEFNDEIYVLPGYEKL